MNSQPRGMDFSMNSNLALQANRALQRLLESEGLLANNTANNNNNNDDDDFATNDDDTTSNNDDNSSQPVQEDSAAVATKEQPSSKPQNHQLSHHQHPHMHHLFRMQKLIKFQQKRIGRPISPSSFKKQERDQQQIKQKQENVCEEDSFYNFHHNFLSWFTLFVEALDFVDLPTLINAQLTCRHVMLLMAQNNTFQKFFFNRLQPASVLKRSLGVATNSKNKVNNQYPVWTLFPSTRCVDDKNSSEDAAASTAAMMDDSNATIITSIQDVPSEEENARMILNSSLQNYSSSVNEIKEEESLTTKSNSNDEKDSSKLNEDAAAAPENNTSEKDKKKNENENEEEDVSSSPASSSLQYDPRQNWKVISRRFQLQTRGFSCKVSTPEYYRGIWRFPEQDIWRRDHLYMMKSPPFFMKPRPRSRDISSNNEQDDALLRNSKFPSSRILEQQKFEIILQRTSRGGSANDENALGIFLQLAGDTTLTSPAAKHEACFVFHTLDRSLSVKSEYKTIGRFAGQMVFTTTQTNSGCVLRQNKLTRFGPNHPDFKDREYFESQQQKNNNSNNIDENEILELLQKQQKGHFSPEDLVLEVEVFSLGQNITEPDDVLSRAEEFARVLSLGDQTSPQMRNLIWRMLRNLSHTDPYLGGIMSKRKRLLSSIISSLVRDFENDEEPDLFLQCSAALWNLSDVDVPPVPRDALEKIIKKVMRMLNEGMEKWAIVKGSNELLITTDDSSDSDDDDDNNRDAANEERVARKEKRNELRFLRRRFAILAPSYIGCLWNFPQSLSGTIDMFSRYPREFLTLLVRIMNVELRQEEKLLIKKRKHDEKVERQRRERRQAGRRQRSRRRARRRNRAGDENTEQEAEDEEEVAEEEEEEEEEEEKPIFKAATFLKPNPAIIFAACHFISRAIFFLYKRIDRVTAVLHELDAETALQRGVAYLNRAPLSLESLGVALFSRDYAIFFIPLLFGGSRSSKGCVELAAFAFRAGYFSEATDYDFDEELPM